MGKVKDFLAGPFRDSRAMAATLVVLLVAPGLPAYEVPLSPASLHDAWVLGQRNDQATAESLTPYLKQITEGSQGGAHIAEIEVLTPFSQVVDQSRQNLSGYTEQQAAQDYRQRGDMVVVRVLLMLPSAFPKRDSGPAAASPSQAQETALRPENFWQNFRFNVKQHGKILATRSIHNKPVYSAPTKDSPSVLDGATECCYCGKPPQPDDPFVACHIYAQSRGGPKDGPLAAGHRSCNAIAAGKLNKGKRRR